MPAAPTPTLTRPDIERLAAGCLMASFEGTVPPRWLLDAIGDGLGGVCLFAPNVQSDAQVRMLVSRLREARADVVVAIDEEGGDVTRLDATTGSPHVGAAALGALDNVAATAAEHRIIGRRLRLLGIDVDLAPCADVNVAAANPVIGARSFGDDPQCVARHVAAAVAGLQAVGVAACAKHFPGHGATADDSHRSLPVIDADRELLVARELPPFEAAIDAGTAAVMTAHIVAGAFGAEPATRSRAVLDLLRHDLGFDGVIVSDALDMAGVHGPGVAAQDVSPTMIGEAAVASLAAGCDLLCLGARQGGDVPSAAVAAIAAAVGDGRLDGDRLTESVTRIARLRRTNRDDVDRGRDAPRAADDERAVALLADRALTVRGDRVRPVAGALVVDCRSQVSMANYDVAWGLGADLSDLDATVATMDATPSTAPSQILARAGKRPLVVAVRAAAAHPWQRHLVEALSAARPDLISVELGWPDPGAPADITTYGASRASTRAVARLLTGDHFRPTPRSPR